MPVLPVKEILSTPSWELQSQRDGGQRVRATDKWSEARVKVRAEPRSGVGTEVHVGKIGGEGKGSVHGQDGCQGGAQGGGGRIRYRYWHAISD